MRARRVDLRSLLDAVGRLSDLGARARLGEELSSTNPTAFMNAALALLKRCSFAAAVCGDKSSLEPRVNEYYGAFYRFAVAQSDLAMVRIFGQWREIEDRDVRAKRKERYEEHSGYADANVGAVSLSYKDAKKIAEPVRELMQVPGLGFVLFRFPTTTTALVHWSAEDGVFQWVAVSDPLLVAVLIDAWGKLENKASKRTVSVKAIRGFRRRFGMREDGRTGPQSLKAGGPRSDRRSRGRSPRSARAPQSRPRSASAQGRSRRPNGRRPSGAKGRRRSD